MESEYKIMGSSFNFLLKYLIKQKGRNFNKENTKKAEEFKTRFDLIHDPKDRSKGKVEINWYSFNEFNEALKYIENEFSDLKSEFIGMMYCKEKYGDKTKNADSLFTQEISFSNIVHPGSILEFVATYKTMDDILIEVYHKNYIYKEEFARFKKGYYGYFLGLVSDFEAKVTKDEELFKLISYEDNSVNGYKFIANMPKKSYINSVLPRYDGFEKRFKIYLKSNKLNTIEMSKNDKKLFPMKVLRPKENCLTP